MHEILGGEASKGVQEVPSKTGKIPGSSLEYTHAGAGAPEVEGLLQEDCSPRLEVSVR